MNSQHSNEPPKFRYTPTFGLETEMSDKRLAELANIGMPLGGAMPSPSRLDITVHDPGAPTSENVITRPVSGDTTVGAAEQGGLRLSASHAPSVYLRHLATSHAVAHRHKE